MENTSSKPKKQGGLFSKFAFAMGNMGHAAYRFDHDSDCRNQGR